MTQPGNTHDPFWLNLSVNVVATAAIFGWGMYIGSRRELVWTLRHRAERAESEQELRVEQARANERARIAREMHDVLAHRISLISMHAGALAYREDLTPEQVHISASVIQDKAHEALTDLRGVLGVLRDADGEPALAPQPTYADLGQLVAEARESGLNVAFYDRVSAADQVPDAVGPDALPDRAGGNHQRAQARTGHAAHRRARRLARGRPRHRCMRNPLGFGSATPGSGLGLVGLTERAELRGGRLDVRRDGRLVRAARVDAVARHDDPGAHRRRRPAGPVGARDDARRRSPTSRWSARPATAAWRCGWSTSCAPTSC